MAVVWDAGVNSGMLTPSEFVKVSSTNAAQIFNMYPRKGVIAAGAMPTSWCGTRKARAPFPPPRSSPGAASMFEGRTVRGIPSTTIAAGKVVFHQGELMAVEGAGRYIERPAFSATTA
jgi:dihydropyrimidinase